MKTCDLCKTMGYGHVDLHAEYQTSSVKVLCDRCADIVNAYMGKCEEVLTDVTAKFEAKLKKRLLTLQQELHQERVGWLSVWIKSAFKSQAARAAFDASKSISENLKR